MGLREVMEQQGRKHVWLAEQTGVSPSLITRIMDGERTATPAFRREAAKALGVDEEELFPAPEPQAA